MWDELRKLGLLKTVTCTLLVVPADELNRACARVCTSEVLFPDEDADSHLPLFGRPKLTLLPVTAEQVKKSKPLALMAQSQDDSATASYFHRVFGYLVLSLDYGLLVPDHLEESNHTAHQ